jgi:hypothetical protein
MSRHPYFVVSDLLKCARHFQRYASRLVEPVDPLADFRINGPVFDIELGLAVSANHFHRFWPEYVTGIVEFSPHPFSLPLRRAIQPVPELIESLLQQWGWDRSVLTDVGFARITEHCETQRSARYNAILQAAASWRLLGKNLTENPRADEFAREAELKFIEPSMTPEEGEQAYPQRVEEWYMTPSMADAIPALSIPRHGQLCNAIDELEKHFRRETMPSPFSAEPKCAEDWRATVELWKWCTLEMLNRGYNWSDYQWEIFGIYAQKLMEFVWKARPDLDVKPLSELADFGTARNRSQDDLAVIANRSLGTLRSVIDVSETRGAMTASIEDELPIQTAVETDGDLSHLAPLLSEDQKLYLIAAFELSAFDSDSRRTSVQIVTTAKGRHAEPASAKKALSDLVSPKKLLRSKNGKQGGYWLTEAGKLRAKRLLERYPSNG